MANWKNPFVHQKQERENDVENHDEESTKKNKKDVRVSCEAIPEEIAGMGEWDHHKCSTVQSVVSNSHIVMEYFRN